LAAAQNDWQYPQREPEVSNAIAMPDQARYGFLNMHSGYFTNVSYTENEVNDVGNDIETCPLQRRREKRMKRENNKWDDEHYL
jgi:protein SHQ1